MRSSSLSIVPAIIIGVLLAALVACGDGTPAEQALDAAEDKVEEASDAIDDMQRDVEALESEEADLRRQLDAAARAQAELWEQQLTAYRERVTALPAEAEQRLQPQLAELEQQVTALRATLGSYASATADAAPGLREDIESAISRLQEGFADFEASLREAGAPPPTP